VKGLRGKNRLSYDIHMLWFEGNVRKLCGCFCGINTLTAVLVFLVGSYVVGFGIQ
jgi:hypothetical protein